MSHGCIRVENPFELGDYLMNGNKAYEKAKQSDENKQFNAVKKYPVFITYYTTWADEKGNLQYRADVYDRDAKVIAALKTLENDLKWNFFPFSFLLAYCFIRQAIRKMDMT